MGQTDKQVPKQLQPYTWKKGQSGNLKGRPKGKTLKEFAREYLESLPDDEKIDYLASIDPRIVWEMAEGKAKQDVEAKIEGNFTIEISKEIAEKNGITPSSKTNS